MHVPESNSSFYKSLFLIPEKQLNLYILSGVGFMEDYPFAES